MTLPVFCDWLKVSDSAVTQSPSSWHSRILRTSGGRVEWERQAWIDVRQTSSASSCRARFIESGENRADGQHGILTIDGNLGRFGQPDNLFGLSVTDCPERVLQVIEQATQTRYQLPDLLDLRRVDLTCNFVFENATDASAFINWAQQMHIGRAAAKPYPTGCTWVTENWSAKVYDKIADLKRHKQNDLANELQEREGYVLRLETTIRTDELKRLELSTLDKWKVDTMNVIFSDRFAPILRGENLPTLDRLADTLPMRLGMALQAWRNGMDYQAALKDGRISRRTYYRIKAELLSYGVDISTRCNIHTLAIRPRLLEMRPLHKPEWMKAA